MREGSYWKYGFMQDPGMREVQQDHVAVVEGEYKETPALLAVLADGMGGMENGAEFSRIVVDYHCEHFQETLKEKLSPPGILLSLALLSNRAANKIYDPAHPGGTTLISVMFTGEDYYTLSVGDSRISLFRKPEKCNHYVPLQINREHVLGPALDERAWMGFISREDATGNIYRESLTSSLGPEKVKRIDFPDYPSRMLKNDQILLMSDGIYKTVEETALASFLENEPGGAAQRIIGEVKCRGKKDQDNMSVIIVRKC